LRSSVPTNKVLPSKVLRLSLQNIPLRESPIPLYQVKKKAARNLTALEIKILN